MKKRLSATVMVGGGRVQDPLARGWNATWLSALREALAGQGGGRKSSYQSQLGNTLVGPVPSSPRYQDTHMVGDVQSGGEIVPL
jgi:hypothetical protein